MYKYLFESLLLILWGLHSLLCPWEKKVNLLSCRVSQFFRLWLTKEIFVWHLGVTREAGSPDSHGGDGLGLHCRAPGEHGRHGQGSPLIWTTTLPRLQPHVASVAWCTDALGMGVGAKCPKEAVISSPFTRTLREPSPLWPEDERHWTSERLATAACNSDIHVTSNSL